MVVEVEKGGGGGVGMGHSPVYKKEQKWGIKKQQSVCACGVAIRKWGGANERVVGVLPRV